MNELKDTILSITPAVLFVIIIAIYIGVSLYLLKVSHLMEDIINSKTKSKLDEIMMFYKFRPSFYLWFSKDKHKSHNFFFTDETYYGGRWFNVTVR